MYLWVPGDKSRPLRRAYTDSHKKPAKACLVDAVDAISSDPCSRRDSADQVPVNYQLDASRKLPGRNILRPFL